MVCPQLQSSCEMVNCGDEATLLGTSFTVIFHCFRTNSAQHTTVIVLLLQSKQEFVRPRWPYDMRPSARAENYIRDAGP